MLKHTQFYPLLQFFLTKTKNNYDKSNTGLDALKTASKRVIHKAVEATSEFIGNKIADTVAKLDDNKIVKTKSAEEIILLPEKREEILRKLRQVSKFVTKNGSK